MIEIAPGRMLSPQGDVGIAGPGLACTAGVVGLVVEGVYLVIISDEGDLLRGRVSVVSAATLAASALAFVGAFATSLSIRARLIVLAAATGGLMTLGVLGIFSVGFPLLVAGVLCAAAWGRVVRAARTVPTGAPVLSAVVAIAVGSLFVLGVVVS